MEQILKEHFHEYIINDASNRSFHDMNRLQDICKSNKRVLVFALKNNSNKRLFLNPRENKYGDILFYHYDKKYLFNMDDSLHFLFSMKRMLADDYTCTICLEKCDTDASGIVHNSISCSKCGIFIHSLCMIKYVQSANKYNCPHCDNETYTPYY